MATTGAYRNEESCESLKTYFVEIVRRGKPPPGQWLETWERMLSDRWYQAEVKMCAARAGGRYHLPRDLVRDLSQEVMLLFRAKLRHDPHLSARPEKLEDNFRAWLGTMILHACGEVLRRPAFASRVSAAKKKTAMELNARPEAQPCEETSLDLLWDLAAAVSHLEGLERDVITLHLRGKTQTEIADELGASQGVSKKQVEYAFAQGKKHVVRWLRGYAVEEDRSRVASPP